MNRRRLARDAKETLMTETMHSTSRRMASTGTPAMTFGCVAVHRG
jgi:hypothetical protein